MSETTQRTWLIWLKRISIGIAAIVLSSLLAIVGILYWYEDEIKQYAVSQLNAHLKVKVSVADIDLTIWDQFPSTSLRFTDVLIPDYTSENQQDTLLFAKNLYLNFNFWDMVSGKYEVNEIAIKGAYAHIKTTADGINNFDIWNTDTTVVSDGKFSFNIRELKSNDFTIRYAHEPSLQFYSFHSDALTFSGNFNEENYLMGAQGDVFIHSFHSSGITWLTNKQSTLDAKINIHSALKKYEIEKALLTVEKINFDAQGYYSGHSDSALLDMHVKGSNIDLASAFSVFPVDYLSQLERYNAKGEVIFDAHIYGDLNSNEQLHVTADFGVEKGSITEKEVNVTLTDVHVSGSFDNHNKDGLGELNLKAFSAKLDVGTVQGNLLLTNFNAPIIQGNSTGQVSLKKLHQFLNSSSIADLAGQVAYNIGFKGAMINEVFDLQKADGTIEFTEGKIALPSSPVVYSKLSGMLQLKNNDALVKQVTGLAADSDFKLDGVVKNLIPYIFKPQQSLTIEADLRADHIYLDHLLISAPSSGGTASTTQEPFVLPEYLNLNLKAQIKELTYGKLITQNLQGVIVLQNRHLTAKNISFLANKGKYTCSTELEQLKDAQLLWTLQLNAQQINIKSIFQELDNFGQDFLTDQHINGTGNMNLHVLAILDKNLNLIPSSILAQADIALQNGSLQNQSSLIDIATYLDGLVVVNKVIDTKMLKEKLKNVQFAELSNTIHIAKSVITIPKMTIQSNVMDLSIGGTHSFDDMVDYHFNFRLREILVKNKNQEEFGPIKDDGLGKKLFLRMYGHLDNPQYELDKEERKIEFKENLAQEKQTVKSILKEELGLFKKDTSLKGYTAPEKAKPTFEVEWEDLPKPAATTSSSGTTKTSTDKDNGLNKFMKKLGAEEPKKTPVKLEIDN
jgi:hypothetical protein